MTGIKTSESAALLVLPPLPYAEGALDPDKLINWEFAAGNLATHQELQRVAVVA